LGLLPANDARIRSPPADPDARFVENLAHRELFRAFRQGTSQSAAYLLGARTGAPIANE
jgi:hypothetical protein